ncbi:hypothetical protein GGE46_003857 [Rhizobium etli]|uniref:Uncharacterized protein n=1 Tax=Rhizobium etli TaxID=29449 RepID=A0A7W6VBM4_RHIET|nr:hypothetical protein [Rhizobium etli]MBB4537126.1 hypothetical protein [Rhizobium etli]
MTTLATTALASLLDYPGARRAASPGHGLGVAVGPRDREFL